MSRFVRSVIFCLIPALLLDLYPAYAVNCRALLARRAGSIAMGEMTPLSHRLRLPRDFINRFQGEPEFQRLRETYGNGEKVVFAVHHYSPNFRDGFMDSMFGRNFGETIQAQFAVQLLRLLFPKSTFTDDIVRDYPEWREKNPDKKLVTIWLNDASEKTDADIPRLSAFQMPILKRLNPGFWGIPHRSFRKGLGIPEDSFVASLYMHPNSGKTGEPSEFPSPASVVKEIERTRSLRVAILSHTGSSRLLKKADLEREFPDRTVLPLSLLGRQPLDPNGRYLFYNDTKGLMPIVYNISDVSIVSGPVNIFESITSGAPVLFFKTPSAIGLYDSGTFEKMSVEAVATGGGFALTSVSQIPDHVRQILGSRLQVTPPYALPSRQFVSSPMQDLLNHISSVLQLTFYQAERRQNEYDDELYLRRYGIDRSLRPSDWTPY